MEIQTDLFNSLSTTILLGINSMHIHTLKGIAFVPGIQNLLCLSIIFHKFRSHENHNCLHVLSETAPGLVMHLVGRILPFSPREVKENKSDFEINNLNDSMILRGISINLDDQEVLQLFLRSCSLFLVCSGKVTQEKCFELFTSSP